MRDGRRACSTSRTWARSRPAGPDAPRSCSGCCQTTSGACPRAAPSTASCCREDGGVLDDLFTYRLADCHFLTVTNAANHERDLAWLRLARRRIRRRRDRPAATTSRCSPSRARARASLRRRARRRQPAAADALLPAHGRRRRRCSSAAPATPARTASSCCSTRRTRPAVWDALLAAGATPGRARRARHAAARGLLSPVRQRPQRGPRPDRGRASAGAAGRPPGFIGADERRRARGPRARRAAGAVRDRRRAGSRGRATRSSAAAR